MKFAIDARQRLYRTSTCVNVRWHAWTHVGVRRRTSSHIDGYIQWCDVNASACSCYYCGNERWRAL